MSMTDKKERILSTPGVRNEKISSPDLLADKATYRMPRSVLEFYTGSYSNQTC